MPTATSTILPIADRSARERNLTRQILRDLGGILLLTVVALAGGLGMNHYSSAPLPLVYQTPEQRFDAELTTLVAVPAFQIAPAATVGLDEFRSDVEKKNALILDARPSVFFEQGHVPGALNLSRESFARDYRRLSPVLNAVGNKPVIVYCSGGECHDSRLVANALLSLGLSNVRVFTGGWDGWSAAGLPVSTGSVR